MLQKEQLIIKCCVCGRWKTEQGWQYQDESYQDDLLCSHGFCATCYAAEIMKIRLQDSQLAAALYQ